MYEQRNELEKAINELGDTKKQIMMYKIKGYSLGKIAYKMNYSKRWIEKLYSQSMKEFGETRKKHANMVLSNTPLLSSYFGRTFCITFI